MEHWMLETMNSFGYLGIFLLILAENIFPPIPSEVILTFSGFMTTYTKMHVPGVVLSSTAGSLVGAVVLYQIGNLLSQERLEHLVAGPVGKTLRLKKEHIQQAVNWFDSKGNYTVFFCRFIPIVRSLISIPAGMAAMTAGRFLWMTALGSFFWNLALISLGAFAGSSWEKAAQYFGNYTKAAKIVLLAALIIGGILFFAKNYEVIALNVCKKYIVKFFYVFRCCAAATTYNICSCLHQTFHAVCKLLSSHRIYRLSLFIDNWHPCIWLHNQWNTYSFTHVLYH